MWGRTDGERSGGAGAACRLRPTRGSGEGSRELGSTAVTLRTLSGKRELWEHQIETRRHLLFAKERRRPPDTASGDRGPLPLASDAGHSFGHAFC